MEESAAAVAEPARAWAGYSRAASSPTARAATLAAPLPSLIDPRLVRAELTRLRGPLPAALARARPSRARREPLSDVRRPI